jgi:gluconate kinase
MVIIISGATHTGKTLFAQKLLEKYKYPYLSIDHLKMGLIRSNLIKMKASDNDEKITNNLWPIIKEIIKTAIENKQNLIVEGCYIPFDWKNDFHENYLKNIKFTCLIMAKEYLLKNYENIISNSCVIEERLIKSSLSIEQLVKENEANLRKCQTNNLNYILIKDNYNIDYTI